jgi:hypothetical protein
MIMRLIGDVHGKYDRYKKIIGDCKNSVQVGDMGVGFRRLGTMRGDVKEFYANPPHYAMTEGNHRFIRGNHDNPSVCKNHSQYIPDGYMENNMMFVGGALSIDRHMRQEDYNWWPEEELSMNQLNDIIDNYLQHKPEIMVTHECPDDIAFKFLYSEKFEDKSRTRQAFSSMWQMHKPKMWIFGHWHRSYNENVLGTQFICLNELEYVDIDTENCYVIERREP